MQNTQLNEEILKCNLDRRNFRKKVIDKLDRAKISKIVSMSTKFKSCPAKILDEYEPQKIGEAGYVNLKNEEVNIIKTKEINKNKNIHLKSEVGNNKVELPGLNTNHNPFAVNGRRNEENLISLCKKVNNNKLYEKIVNEKNKNINQKEKQKKKIKKANLRKKLMKKKFPKPKKEVNSEIPTEIINALIWSYEHPKISDSIHIPIQPFENINSLFCQNSKINNDEVLNEEALRALSNINSNRPRYNIREEDIIMDENDGENLFNLNENNLSALDWVDLNLLTNEVL